MKLNCVVVDDEKEALNHICELIQRDNRMQIIGAFLDPIEALNFIKHTSDIYLTIIDVNMPAITGLELAELIKCCSRTIIFSTSHAKYALDAFDVEADGFLLKPFNFAKLTKTFEKILKKNPYHKLNLPLDDEYIFVKNKEDHLKIIKVWLKEIVAVESQLNYVRLHLEKKGVLTHLTLKEAEKIFSETKRFLRLHRSFLISTNHIISIDGNLLLMSNGDNYTVGKSYRPQLDSFLSQKLLKMPT